MLDELRLRVRLEDGSLWATVEQLPGIFATGDTVDELRESLREAVALYIAEPGEEPPAITLGELDLRLDTTAEIRLQYA